MTQRSEKVVTAYRKVSKTQRFNARQNKSDVLLTISWASIDTLVGASLRAKTAVKAALMWLTAGV
jgi:thiamine pyrophosphokinase